ncbi:hypothetical protein DFP72DRAFT_1070969 [Ephemerocybe angulata]|uniref:Uncharacterized protein n=1 Tax=Ephemerocybe angulata TaxID=980116 RepID=A0A8H6HSF2_9AGAR|nr:hypothetical protein DFP72DRAFT_1070969 [Tulosesus angulatus]
MPRSSRRCLAGNISVVTSSASNSTRAALSARPPIPCATTPLAGIIYIVTSSKCYGGEAFRPAFPNTSKIILPGAHAVTPFAGMISVATASKWDGDRLARVLRTRAILTLADRLESPTPNAATPPAGIISVAISRNWPVPDAFPSSTRPPQELPSRLHQIRTPRTLLATPLAGFNYIVFSQNEDVGTHFGFSVARRTHFCCVFAVPAVESSLSSPRHPPSRPRDSFLSWNDERRKTRPSHRHGSLLIVTIRVRDDMFCHILSAYGRYFAVQKGGFSGCCLSSRGCRRAFDVENTRTPRRCKLSASEASTRGNQGVMFR